MNWTDLKAHLKFRLDQKAVRQFGLILSGLILGYFLLKEWQTGSLNMVGVNSGVIIAVFAVIFPKGLYIIYVPWMIAVRIIGFIIFHSLLAIVFYAIFTPVGIVMRLFGRDQLRLKKKDDSYWIKRASADQSRLERMF